MADEGRADWRVRLVQAVQTNCDIADARHATDLSLCTYLLQMREFFRWERGLPYGAALPQSEVGNWIAAREARWQAHEGRAAHDYEVLPIPLPGSGPGDVPIRTIAAFDVEAANAALLPRGLLYGAGLVDGAGASETITLVSGSGNHFTSNGGAGAFLSNNGGALSFAINLNDLSGNTAGWTEVTKSIYPRGKNGNFGYLEVNYKF